MKQNPAAAVEPSEEILALVRTLHQTQQRLQELTGGQVDSVLHPDGQSYLLHDAQEKLRQSGEALRLSENALALGQQIAHLGSWEIDLHDLDNLEANPLRWSDEMFRIGGYEPGSVEVTNGLFFSLIPEEDRTSLRQALAKAVSEKKQYAIVHRLIRPDGEERFVHQMGQIFLAEDGIPEKIVGTALDITEQKKAERQLSLLHTCVTKLNDIVIITDATTLDPPGPEIVFVNEAFERITGYKTEEVIGRNPRFLQGARTDRKVLSEIREALVQKKPIKRQLYNYRRDGTEYCLEMDILPVFDDKGKCTNFVAIESDVTEENKNKEQLAWRTAMFEAQVSCSLDGILIVDSNDRKVLQNQRMTDLWEIPAPIAENIEDRPQFEWVSRRVRNTEQFVEKIAYLKANPDEISRDELELVNGKFLDRYSAPVRDSDGKYYGRIWVFRDITERKQAQRRTEEQMHLMEMAGRVGQLGAWSLEWPSKKLVWSNEIYRLYEVEADYQPEVSSALAFYPPPARAKIATAIQDGKTYDFETEFVTAKGNKRWVRTTSAVEKRDGAVHRFYGLFQDITQQKLAENALRAQTERLDLATRSAGIGIWDWNIQNDELVWDERMYALYGIKPGDFAGVSQAWLNCLHPEDRIKNHEDLMKAVQGEGEFSTEFRVLWPDGSTHTLKAYGHVVRDEKNQPIRMIGVNYDITLSKLAEQAQRLSEERFSHAFEYAPNGMILVGIDGRVITANRIMCDLIGYTLDELIRKDFDEITHPDDVLVELEHVRQMAAGQIHFYKMDKRYLHKEGHELWVHLSSSLVRGAKNEPLYFIKQVQDISEIKRAYEQIAEQAALIDEASDAIFSRDLEHRVMFWGKGAERLLGYTAEEAKGKFVKDLLKIDGTKFAEADKALRADGHWGGELLKTTKGGVVLTCNTRWTIVRDSGGQPRSILTIASDVTERKKLEQQFLRAQRMESIGTLAGGIAHDLNNILAPIMMSIDVLKSLSEEPETLEILETIRISAKRGSDIVRQVLSFARGVEGKRIEVQPKHILEDVENIVKNTFPKSVEVRTNIPRDTWTILGDPTQIHQILLNLCVNARDAMPNGGKLNLAVENFTLDDQYSVMSQEAKPGPYVQISVTDSGTGIPPELLERIFEPFFTTKEVSKGTGLGLSTVMAIVKSHEGLINVYSEVGKGTTFRVYLPALESTPEKRKVQTQRVSLPRGNGETILVVDDEASILTITAQTLLAFGYRVLKAGDGAEAVALYAKHEHEIAVVLTDMMMPVLDGSAFIHALKRMNPAVKIIAASGLTADSNMAKATEAGVNHFLAKPYTAGTLLKTLNEILSGN